MNRRPAVFRALCGLSILFLLACSPVREKRKIGAEIILEPREIFPGEKTQVSLRFWDLSPALPEILWQADEGSIETALVHNEVVYNPPIRPGRYSIRAQVKIGNASYEASSTVLVKNPDNRDKGIEQGLESLNPLRASAIETYASLLFADSSPLYLYPAEPGPEEAVTVKFRAPAQAPGTVILHSQGPLGKTRATPMELKKTDSLYSFFAAEIPASESEVEYWYEWREGGDKRYYGRNGVSEGEPEGDARFRYLPGSRLPAWARGAWLYRIIPDRFFNGDKGNDGKAEESGVSPSPEDSKLSTSGGDIAGIAQKLQYLKALGVDAIILDELLDSKLQIKTSLTHSDSSGPRVSQSPNALAIEDASLSDLLARARGRGLKLIMDTAGPGGADAAEALLGLARSLSARGSGFNGLRPPARKEAEASLFYEDFRAAVKASNPDAIVMAPSRLENGGSFQLWDIHADNQAFFVPLSVFLTGRDPLAPATRNKSSVIDGGMNDGRALERALAAGYARLPLHAAYALSLNIDEPGFARMPTRIAQSIAVLDQEDSQNLGLAVYRIAILLQMSLPGSPLSLYGAEQALQGSDGDGSLPSQAWENENSEIASLYRELGLLRKNLSALRSGSYLSLTADNEGVFAYSRWDSRSRLIVAINNGNESHSVLLPAARAGFAPGERLKTALLCSISGHTLSGPGYLVKPEGLRITIPARGGILLSSSGSRDQGLTEEKGPLLQHTFPADRAKSLALDTRIVMEFSEDMEQTSILESFSIEPEAAGKFLWNGSTCIFVPDAPLKPKTRYRVRLAQGLRASRAGLSLKAEKSFNFSTE